MSAKAEQLLEQILAEIRNIGPAVRTTNQRMDYVANNALPAIKSATVSLDKSID